MEISADTYRLAMMIVGAIVIVGVGASTIFIMEIALTLRAFLKWLNLQQ